MIPPGSRYEDADHVFTQAHVYNQFGYPYLQDDEPNLKIIVVNRETTYRVATQSTDDPTVQQQQEYYAKDGETMQFLAFRFFQDPKRWHEIAESNPDLWYPLDLSMGDYIRVSSEPA